VTYTKDLVPWLKVCRRTVYSWMSIYAQYGLKELLASKKRGGNTPVIEERTKVAIAEKLADPLTTMTSYVELLDWVHREYQSNVKYTTLHKHCREHHNSVLIVSRKSHHKKDKQATKKFKEELPDKLRKIKTEIDETKFDSFNLYFQDESRFGLMTKQKRVLVSKGVKPIGKYQHSYQSFWLWGCFSPITGNSFYRETSSVSNDLFEGFLNDFSKQNPKELKILIIDNAGFHASKNITIPENIKLIRIPPYTPELNPAEKVWQWMKERVAMKFFEDLESLKKKITEVITQLKSERIKSITGYDLYTKTFFEQL